MSFQCRLFIFIGVLVFCSVFGPVYVYGDAQKSTTARYKNYNVILIYIDTLRADRLSCYGYSRKTSPNIDKLANESIVFTRNYTPITYTLASFMSIITSLYPKSHGVLEILKDKLSPGIKTLAEVMHIYGYKTAWFGPKGDPHLDPAIGFGLGFDEIMPSNESHDLDNPQGRDLCNWLEANKDKRFFLNFHTYKPHLPYLPSPAYREKFGIQKQAIVPSSMEEVKKKILTKEQGTRRFI